MDFKPVIYQIIPRLFSNVNDNCIPNGDIETNGSGKLKDITNSVINSIKELGVTHIWLTGVIEHAQCTDYSNFGIESDNPNIVKGKAGSPYAIKDYYDIDPDLAVSVPDRMSEFEDLVKRIHNANLSVIIDFVPNHVARRYHSDAAPSGTKNLGENDNVELAFSPDNNFYYIPHMQFVPESGTGSADNAYIEFPAKATGNDCFTAFPSVNDWYETVKLNYGVDYQSGTTHFNPIPDTWFKMRDILLFWANKGVDGFRCDMAHMVPVEFWDWAIISVKNTFPNIKFIAEIYDVNLYREYIFKGKFDYLYDKVNLYDTLRAIQTMGCPASAITGCWQTVDGIASHMLHFLENHDEQRFASAQYAGDCMKVLPSLTVSALINTGPMMIYMGQELGEKASDAEGFSGCDGRTTIFDYWSLPTLRRWLKNGRPELTALTPREKILRNLYAKILNLCNKSKAISSGSFFDLMYVNYDNPGFNPDRQYAFLRHHNDELILIAVNFGAESADAAIRIPDHAFQYLNIKEGKAKCTEFITGQTEEQIFSADVPFTTYIAPYGAVIWKIEIVEKNIRNGKSHHTKKM